MPTIESEIVAGESQALELGPFKQRILLAMLLCRANSVVSVDELVDALWWEDPPRTAHKNIQVYVSHLRRVLSPQGVFDRVVRRPPGYRLVVDPADLDAMHFEDLVRRGRLALRQGEHEEAAGTLRTALDLWRGPALADLVSSPALQSESARLEERRLAAHEDWIEAELALGRHTDVLEHIEVLVRTHPLRERLRSQQLVALYRSGRQTEAVAEYDNVRRTLAAELGLQPSPVLRRLYQSILVGHASLEDPARGESAAAAPAGRTPEVVAHASHLSQIPRDIEDFTARDAQVDEVTGVLAGEWRGGARRLVTIAGPPGAGKTTLAVHTAHRLRQRFPDGQILVPMRAPDGAPRATSAVLGGLLRQLRVAVGEAAGDVEELGALLRGRLADRQVLLVLDGAENEAQVRPLLPGVGGSGALVTSWRHLGGLEAAHHVHLGPLGLGEAIQLLAGVVGSERIARGPAVAERIVRACGLLPLTVRIAGARLAALPHITLEQYAERLTDEWLLDELVAGDLSFRRAVEPFVRGLPDPDRRAVEQLGLLDRSVVTATDLAALLGLSERAASGMLERLAEGQALLPVERQTVGPRVMSYRIPDPLRLYARERARAVPPPHRLDLEAAGLFGGLESPGKI